jgi:hypothetical protein
MTASQIEIRWSGASPETQSFEPECQHGVASYILETQLHIWQGRPSWSSSNLARIIHEGS